MPHGSTKGRRGLTPFTVPQGSPQGCLDTTIRGVHFGASLTPCTTFVNLGRFFVQTLDTLVLAG